MKSALNDSAIRVLEGAAFLFTDVLPDERRPDTVKEWNPIIASLWYNGPNQGVCELWISPGLAKIVAQNMLGLDSVDSIPENKYQDSAKELLNMVVGNFLTDAFGVDDVYHLGIPELIFPTEVPPEAESSLHVWIDVEGEPVLFRLEASPRKD